MVLGIPATCLCFLASEMGTVTYLPGLWGGFAEMRTLNGLGVRHPQGCTCFQMVHPVSTALSMSGSIFKSALLPGGCCDELPLTGRVETKMYCLKVLEARRLR